MYMTKLRATPGIGLAIKLPIRLSFRLAILLGFCGAMLVATAATAQIPLPEAKPPDGPTLFKQQCATCHTNNLTDPVRQGPSLFGVIGRRAGSVDGFHYSAGFAKADFVWDDTRLDAWVTNPQAMIPGAVMAYRQAKPETRAAIIAYLKELH
jgi:cytochrome c